MNAIEGIEIVRRIGQCEKCESSASSFKVDFIGELMVVSCRCGEKKVYDQAGKDVTKENMNIKKPLNHYSNVQGE